MQVKLHMVSLKHHTLFPACNWLLTLSNQVNLVSVLHMMACWKVCPTDFYCTKLRARD